MSETRLFSVLGIAPTRDGTAVKRGYFAALVHHQPQTDPEGFRRLREAYEALSDPAQLAAAYASAPLNLVELEREYAVRFDSKIAQAAQSFIARERQAHAVASFVEQFAGTSWEQMLYHLELPAS